MKTGRVHPLIRLFTNAGAALAVVLAIIFSPSGSVLAADSPDEFVAAHNAVRQRVAQAESQRLGGTVSIPDLTWDANLAAYAQDWANQQAARLQQGLVPLHRSNNPYGENMHWGTAGAFTPTYVVERWASEQPNYNYDANTCSSVCGHYTQIVWAASLRLGCGMATGGGQDIRVCNYDPPGNYIGERPYTVSQTPATLQLSANLPAATAGQPYSGKLSASGGAAPYSFSVSALPEGLSLSGNGTISGSPRGRGSAAYTTVFMATVTDAAGRTATQQLQIMVAPAPIVITPNPLPDAVAGQPYQVQLNASGGVAPYSFTSLDRPGELSISSSGLISGIPAGSDGRTVVAPIRLEVSDANGSTAILDLTLLIKPASVQFDTSKTYRLRAAHSNKCLNVPGGHTEDGWGLIQWTCTDGAANELWRFEPMGDGFYRIRGVQSNKCVNVPGGHTEDGWQLIQWTCTDGAANELWKLIPFDATSFILQARHSGKVMDVAGASQADGAAVQQWTQTNSVNQRWVLEARS